MAADQMRAHLGKSDKSESAAMLEVSVWKRLRFFTQAGLNEISKVALWSCDFNQLTKRDICTWFSFCMCVGQRGITSISSFQCPFLSLSHIHILVLFHSKCVSHGSHHWNSLSNHFPTPMLFFPLSSPFLDIFKRTLRQSRVHTKPKWQLLK